MSERAIYITRSDISWYSKNANAYLKPFEVASKYKTTLCVSEACRVPPEIAERCDEIVRFKGLMGLLCEDFLTQRHKDTETQRENEFSEPLNLCASVLKMTKNVELFTGFDFPCMFKAWRLKRRLGCQWTVFLWDPPSLSHRDGFPPLRWAIDAVFRFFAKRCDKLVLNIHPGLLDEIGYKPRDGQVELRMQDAFEGEGLLNTEAQRGRGAEVFEYDFGVLSNWSKAKGGYLVTEALKRMPGKKCLWIGDPPSEKVSGQIDFVGRLPQKEAFERLKKCRILLAPYLPVRSLKWNYVLKLFEYLQLGRPIIASNNPGNVSVAERYPGRIRLFESGKVESLVNEMRV